MQLIHEWIHMRSVIFDNKMKNATASESDSGIFECVGIYLSYYFQTVELRNKNMKDLKGNTDNALRQ